MSDDPALADRDLRILLPDPLRLGEGPLWDAARGRFCFVDIEGRRIHEMAVDGGDHRSWAAPDRPTALGLTRSGRLIVSLAHGIAFFDRDTGVFTPFVAVDTGAVTTRLNDGKVGPDGAFWVGSIDERSPRGPVAALYRITGDGRVEPKIDGLAVSNGLAWSADGRTMFHTDTRGPWIDRWRFDPASGAIDQRTRIATLDDTVGRPDGGACDVEGCYWSAGVSAGRLNRFDRDGHLLSSWRLPVAAPTMPCFGGSTMERLLVTSLAHDLTPERLASGPASGRPIALDAGVAGVGAFLFAD
ncbi:SMP-30/gluconolactonase/LRE family protein [Siculibacillus lacustris]|uniref:SMP-30/gluconolactonase/LRE family protein n=1 Tax=Siculibacillus lacustris TaxID=1549641 RepID=A0A4Q9VT96_9HYPH|nr:SMP-30/gluconolactonase/LRE family protein [Siculibacillus lacustris]TBW39282.1 SMP-30/gluconolactonase/LRE family protein [Siculibacillus lacustris]